jgi:hypothetical protein
VDPVPDPLLLKKSGTSGLVARTSDHWTTDAVLNKPTDRSMSSQVMQKADTS